MRFKLQLKTLERRGYKVEYDTLDADDFGVAQTRTRHFLIARKDKKPDFTEIDQFKLNKPRTLRWAIEDLKSKLTTEGDFNSTTKKKTDLNQERTMNMNMSYVMSSKPPSHQKKNTHPAVYGRMHWDEPSSTITAGFTSNGQVGTHPDANPGRTITPHEGARIQSFPDWYKFPR